MFVASMYVWITVRILHHCVIVDSVSRGCPSFRSEGTSKDCHSHALKESSDNPAAVKQLLKGQSQGLKIAGMLAPVTSTSATRQHCCNASNRHHRRVPPSSDHLRFHSTTRSFAHNVFDSLHIFSSRGHVVSGSSDCTLSDLLSFGSC